LLFFLPFLPRFLFCPPPPTPPPAAAPATPAPGAAAPAAGAAAWDGMEARV